MMLPGVELARRRRVHHRHEVWPTPPPDPTSSPRLPFSAMDESALAARLRLEEKLHGLVMSPRPSPSSSPSSPSARRPSRRALYGEEITPLRAASGETRTRAAAASAIPDSRSNVGRALQRTGSRIDVCAVCLDEVQAKQRVTRLPCSHKYHTDCVLPWLAAHSHCPCCRTLVPSSDQPS